MGLCPAVRLNGLAECESISRQETFGGFMQVFALFAVFPDRKELIAVFSSRPSAVEFATVCKVESWHIQEVRYVTV